MKRSEINHLINDAKAFFKSKCFKLPTWAYWSIEDWKVNKDKCSEIIENGLGWDITDFGSNDYKSTGLFLFTIRNGNLKKDKKSYAEKIMIVDEGQVTPMHFHWNKMEDIINRGGGNLEMVLYKSDSEEQLSSEDFEIKVDGIPQKMKAGGKLVLEPGESVCFEPGIYHRFYGQEGKGRVLVGEVSAVNDDHSDNCFYDKVGRFPEIEEDEAPIHLLTSDYEKFV